MVTPAAVEAIGEGIGTVFRRENHVPLQRLILDNTLHSLLIEMSAGFVLRTGHARIEAEVRHELISPLLSRVAHCMSSMNSPEGWDGGWSIALYNSWMRNRGIYTQ